SVQLYFDISAQLAVDNDQEAVVWGTSHVGDLTVMHIGTSSQPMLAKSGDNLRMDWGWADLALPPQPGMMMATIGIAERRPHTTEGTFAISDDLAMPRAPRNNLPLLAVRFDLGDVAGIGGSPRAMLACDNILAI